MVATEQSVAEFIRLLGRYRLACNKCDREDFDGVKVLPTDWEDISECQSLAAALSTYDDEGDPDPPPGYSVLDWWTHLGTCPECRE